MTNGGLLVTPPLSWATDRARPDSSESDPLETGSARGGVRPFEAIYREHVGGVYGLCLRLTGSRDLADDCTQETFLAAWRAWPRFQARSTVATWLYRIAVNTVIARHRRPAARIEAMTCTAEDCSAVPHDGSDTSPPLDLERAIAALPDGARHVLVLVGIYGYNHEEAARLLGLTAGTCRAHLHRARQLLKQRLDLTENP
jgi:RNA polymerase sigma-70 factor (ECF subfamily)